MGGKPHFNLTDVQITVLEGGSITEEFASFCSVTFTIGRLFNVCYMFLTYRIIYKMIIKF